MKNEESRRDLFIDGEAEAVQSLAAQSRLQMHIRDSLISQSGIMYGIDAIQRHNPRLSDSFISIRSCDG